MANTPNINHAVRAKTWLLVTLLILPTLGAFWFGFISTQPLAIDSFWHDHVIVAKDSFWFFYTEIFHIVGSTKGMAVVTLIMLVIFAIKKQWWHLITTASTMLTVVVLVKIIKLLVDRPRPSDMLVLETETSFPSGHSLGAGAIATMIICFVYASNKTSRADRITATTLGVLYILTMMWSRTALHVHWLSDTVAGALIGIAVALFYARVFADRLLQELPNNTQQQVDQQQIDQAEAASEVRAETTKSGLNLGGSRVQAVRHATNNPRHY